MPRVKKTTNKEIEPVVEAKQLGSVMPDDITRYHPDLGNGLAYDQYKKRHDDGLENVTKINPGKSTSKIIVSNIVTFFNILIIAIAIVLMVFGKITEAAFAIVAIINTVIAIVQELKAKKTIDKLKLVNAQNVTVIREGKQISIPAEGLVLDDIYSLKNGDQVPTDSIVRQGNVEVNESLLTGESVPVKKKPGDLIYAGSFVVSGSILAQADRVGDYNYASTIQAKAKVLNKPKSELLRSLNTIIKVISFIIIPLGVALFLSQFFNPSIVAAHEELWERFRFVVSKTAGSLVGMIPSGMYLLTTVALAVGVRNLAKKNTLVQDIYSIEMLARVNILCLDKTGTLTDGTMRTDEMLVIDNKYDLKKIMGSYLGAFNESNQTSIALSATFPLRSDYKIKSTTPFSSARKFSAVSFNEIGTFLLGAPEYIYKGKDKAILKYISDKESLGFRVVILCHFDGEIKNDEIPSKAEPVAIFTLEDHVRKEAPNTIKWFVENGVAIKIISGDNPITVSNIAKKCGVPDADKCISLEGLSPSEVAELVDQYTVFGRVSPEQKAAIVKELKRRKMTVGMTGDGVNDILAMKQADCSIAMANGSSAARNVAHLVLLDSNFASMPSVVREGRRVVNNIQRSSSLFLMKTIFTIVFTFIVLMTSAVTGGKGGWIYPFSANNILIMELFCIGLPSFFLALQPNANLIKGHFIKNTFSRAIPAAICLIVAVFINCILFYDTPDFLDTYIYELPNTTVAFTTFCSLTMVVISFGMVYNCCMPFNRYRLILFVSLFAVLLVAIFALPYISALNSNDEYLYWNLSMQFTGTDFRYLTKTMWLVLGIYIALVPSCLNALVDLFANMRGEKPTGLIVNLVSTLKGKNENKNY